MVAQQILRAAGVSLSLLPMLLVLKQAHKKRMSTSRSMRNG